MKKTLKDGDRRGGRRTYQALPNAVLTSARPTQPGSNSASIVSRRAGVERWEELRLHAKEENRLRLHIIRSRIRQCNESLIGP